MYGCLHPFYLQYLSAFIFSLLSSISSWSFPSILAFFSLLVSCSLRRRFLSWKLWNFLTKLISWFRRSFSSSGRLLVHTLLQKTKSWYLITVEFINYSIFWTVETNYRKLILWCIQRAKKCQVWYGDYLAVFYKLS